VLKKVGVQGGNGMRRKLRANKKQEEGKVAKRRGTQRKVGRTAPKTTSKDVFKLGVLKKANSNRLGKRGGSRTGEGESAH